MIHSFKSRSLRVHGGNHLLHETAIIHAIAYEKGFAYIGATLLRPESP